jgi:hypothetical protein
MMTLSRVGGLLGLLVLGCGPADGEVSGVE